MRVLILGGTRFVGRHLTQTLSTDHEVWLANRGRTTTELFGAAGRLDVDRDGDLSALQDERFDAVVDVSAYVPAQVTAVADVMGDRVGRYLLISTVSVYDGDDVGSDPTESAATVPAVRHTAEVTGETYGGLKVACEEEAVARWGDRLTVVRPGVVAGPHDHTDRLVWWVRFLGASTPLPLPDRRSQPVQVIDARDLAAFCQRLLEHGTTGTFDATGAIGDVARLADEVVAVVGSSWVEGATGARWVGLEEWGDTPLPPLVTATDAEAGLFRRDSSAAVRAGLLRRPLRETLADLHSWDLQRDQPPLSTEPTSAQIQDVSRRLG